MRETDYQRRKTVKNTKICIIGGGSRQWAIQFFKDLAYNKMTHGSVVLYDIDKEAARNNVDVARRIFEINDSAGRFDFSAEDELPVALKGCDLVIISIEPGKTECRAGDLLLPEEYGILQSVGDTTGPGGIMRARRAVPLFVDFAKAISENCPEAWVINYTNPMTLCTAALFAGFPQIKAMGCCHEVFHLETFIAEMVSKWFGVPVPNRREIRVDITGVNHFTWITHASWNGIDLMPRLNDLANDPDTYKDATAVAKRRQKEEKWFECDHTLALRLLKTFGALGGAGDRHLAEFLPWFLRSDEEIWKYGVPRTPYEWRVRKAQEKRNKIFTDSELVAGLSDEEGVDIMRALMGDSVLYTNINRLNEGQITYLPKGRVVESNGCISENSIRPIVSSEPPLAVQDMVRKVSDVQQMTLDAIIKGDDDLLFRAFISDPLVSIPFSKAEELFGRMLEACKLVY